MTVAHAMAPQDVIIKARLDQQSSASMIKRVRTFLINNEFGDPYDRQFETPIVLDLKKVLDDLPEDTQKWMKDFQSLLSLELFESSYKMKIENFSYSIDNFSTELMPKSSVLDRIEYVSLNYVQGLRLSSFRIAFQIELKTTTSGQPIKFEIELIEPEFLISPDLMVELPMGWQTALLPNSLLISLYEINLSKVFSKVMENPQLINLHIKDVHMPDVSIRVGNRTLNFDQVKIKNFFSTRKEQMKIAILDLIKVKMEERFSNIIKDTPQEIFIPRSLVTKGKVSAGFDIKSTVADPISRVAEVAVDGHFCANLDDLEHSLCVLSQIPTTIRRQIEATAFDQSMLEIDRKFEQKYANIAVSISEHYINQLITAAVQANLLDLGGKDFKLGSEKAFVLAEVKGEGFNLYLDIIYKLQGSQRVLVGRSELRFPIRLEMGLKIVTQDGFPHLVIKVLRLNTDKDLLINGLPKYNLVTNVNSVRFREKVIKGIMEDIAPFDQKVLVDLELREFKDTYLEELNFYSDGLGRATAILFMNGIKIRR